MRLPRRRRIGGAVAACVAALLALGLGAPEARAAGTTPRLTLRPILAGYERPVLVLAPPGVPDRLYVVEQTGVIRGARLVDGRWRRTGPLLDLTDLVNDPGVVGSGERGLLGMAFPPDHAATGLFYVSYTLRDPDVPWGGGDSVIAEYRRLTPRRADPASARIVMVIEQPYANHNGGHITFGPDGYLYLGLGDGGSYGDPEDRAQDLAQPMGKLLRIDPADPDGDGPLTHRVPEDNPFVGVDGALPEIWLLGVRNPWRFSFDRATGDLVVGDVGEGIREEVDRLRAIGGRDAGRAVNLGWDRCEGNRTFPGDRPCDHAARGFRPPWLAYRHTRRGPFAGGCAVVGGHVFRGPGAAAWQGVYLFGDTCSGRIVALGPAGRVRLVAGSGRPISSFGEDARGRLYVVDLSGVVLRITLSGDPTP